MSLVPIQEPRTAAEVWALKRRTDAYFRNIDKREKAKMAPPALPPPSPPSPVKAVTRTIRASIRCIQCVVADHYGTTQEILLSSLRLAEFVLPRYVAMYLAKELTGRSNPYLGAKFNRDSSTVAHGVAQISDRLAVDQAFAGEIAGIHDRIIAEWRQGKHDHD